jgi:hypothetical protein
MVSLTSGILGVSANNHGNSTSTTPNGSVDSFAQQLATAIEGYLGKSGNSSQFEIDVTAPSGQNSAAGSQFTVTVKNLDPSTPAATTPASTPVATSAAAAPAASVATPAAVESSSAAPAIQSAAPLTAAEKADMTPTQAYWASQPPAVQVLQNTPDDQKQEVAQQLANQGYSIDVPIMVWGWDPLATMIERQTAGYTWVPSAMQSSIQEAPGVGGVSGATPYDPTSPPAGSIPVSTAFAEGTNISSDSVAEMWIHGQSFTVGSPNIAAS